MDYNKALTVFLWFLGISLLLFGGFAAYSRLINRLDDRAVTKDEEVVIARVLSKKLDRHALGQDQSGSFFTEYVFNSTSGIEYTVRQNINAQQYKRILESEFVEVAYNIEDPNSSRIVALPGMRPKIIKIMMFIGVLLIALAITIYDKYD